MRSNIGFAAALSLFLMCTAHASAESLLRGFYIENLPAKATSRALASDKSIVLAHIFNCDDKDLTAGKYQIGVEIDGRNGSKKTFVVAPKDSISAGALKTFRLAVPKACIDKNNGHFKIFSKVNDKVTWSSSCSFSRDVSYHNNGRVSTLYEEAPSVNEIDAVEAKTVVQEPKKAPQETDVVEALRQKLAKAEQPEVKSVSKSSKSSKTVTTAKKTSTVKVASKPKNDVKQQPKKKTVVAKAPAKKVSQPKKQNTNVLTAAPTRNINSDEFKKLKTIDEELVIYVIKKGDTLKSIAAKYYGTTSKERDIADLNFIEKTSAIEVGEEIIVDVRPLTGTKHG